MLGIYGCGHKGASQGSMHTLGRDVNILTDFVGKFSACFHGRPRRRFLNLHFGATFKFELSAGF